MRVKLPGAKGFVTLTSARSIPIGSLVDTTHGQVGLTFKVSGVLDQTFLPPLIAQLREVEDAFPVVGQPTD